MASRTQRGTLVLADISGFTAYLAQTELEHAHDILLELMQLVVERLRPSLTVVEVEGDAIFAYAPEGAFPRGETLLELVEQTYAFFLGRVEAIRLHTTCSCSACRTIPTLDLKFILHYGEYILQAVTGVGKPLGSDVNLAHRLLKNHVGETTGWRAYALLTEPTARLLGLGVDGLHEQIENYENFPPTRTYSFDLRRRVQETREHQGIRVAEADADLAVTVELPVPPPVVWDWFNDPRKRSQWIGLTFERLSMPGGRSGVGMKTHCTHGDKVETLHTILDWQPFMYFTEELARPSDGRPEALNTVELEETSGGTRLHSRYRVLVAPRMVSVPFFRRSTGPSVRSYLQRLEQLVSAEASGTQVSETTAASPE